MTIRERVSHYLRGANDRSLCSGCIGRALVLGEGQVRHALVLLEGSGRFPRLTGRCSACGSVRLVTRFSVSIAATEPPARAPAPLEPDTLTPETARQAPPEETIQERPKCARCSFVIGVTERIVVSQGDVFHAYCCPQRERPGPAARLTSPSSALYRGGRDGPPEKDRPAR